MKMTLDLPDHLMRQVKQRALQQGRPIKELVADYIRQGLHGSAGAPLQPTARVVELDASGMPLFRPDPSFSGPPIDLATALQLEQEALTDSVRSRQKMDQSRHKTIAGYPDGQRPACGCRSCL